MTEHKIQIFIICSYDKNILTVDCHHRNNRSLFIDMQQTSRYFLTIY